METTQATPDKLLTRASSINRALDQIGDKWCLLILQEVFWGINSFSEMLASMGVSRGVLSDRLKWLQANDCLRQRASRAGGRRKTYHLTRKSLELYDTALMALAWEREFFNTPELDRVVLVHRGCGAPFQPQLRCTACGDEPVWSSVSYRPGPGATRDERHKKMRRRSSIPVDQVPSQRSVYRNLINLVGDRWTSNVIALAFHGLTRFEAFHRELPVATNILSDRLRFLVDEGIFSQSVYRFRPTRHEYHLTDRGAALYPFFLTLLHWGDRWCDTSGGGPPLLLQHLDCRNDLHSRVCCDQCGKPLRATEVEFELDAGRHSVAAS